MAQNVYLHHVNFKAKSLESHVKHDFLGQIAGSLKDHVSLHRSDLVVARELGGVHSGSKLITLQGITDLLSQSVGKQEKYCIQPLCGDFIQIKTTTFS